MSGNMKILVTGHRGYIGSVMTPALLKKGFTVRGLDTNYPKNLMQYKNPNFSETIKDIRKITKNDLKGMDAVIHLAGIATDSSSKINPEATKDINIAATLRLATLAREQGIKRFVFSTSCGIYGTHSDFSYCTESTPPAPSSPYTESKLKSERNIAGLADENFTPVFMRNGTVFGWSPRMRFDSPINSFIYGAIRENKVGIKSDGLAWRPVLHIKDLTSAFILALEAPQKTVWNQVFNVGNTKDNFTFKHIAGKIKNVLPDIKIEIGSRPAHSSYKVDFKKIETALNFRTKWTLLRGYNEMIKHKDEYSNEAKDVSNYRMMLHLLNSKQITKNFFWEQK